MDYIPAENRYDQIPYNQCGTSGLRLPAVSLGLWHNFGSVDNYERSKMILFRAFQYTLTDFM